MHTSMTVNPPQVHNEIYETELSFLDLRVMRRKTGLLQTFIVNLQILMTTTYTCTVQHIHNDLQVVFHTPNSYVIKNIACPLNLLKKSAMNTCHFDSHFSDNTQNDTDIENS